MSSQSQAFDRTTEIENSLTLGKRLIWVAIAWAVQLIYLPTSEWLTGGIEPKLPIDVFPVWPVWVVPYVLCYPLWSAGFAWVVFKTDDRKFRSFIIAFLVTCSVSIAIFLLYPTYVRSSEIPGRDAFSTLLRFFHEGTGRYNALPSGHIYITALLAFVQHPGRAPRGVRVPAALQRGDARVGAGAAAGSVKTRGSSRSTRPDSRGRRSPSWARFTAGQPRALAAATS